MAPGPHSGNRFRPAYSSTPRFEYPPLILDAFSPRPPLPYVPPAKARRLRPLDGVTAFLDSFEAQPSQAATKIASERAAYATPARTRRQRTADRRAVRRAAVATATAEWEAKQARLVEAVGKAKAAGGGGKGSKAVVAAEEGRAAVATANGIADKDAAGASGEREDDANLLSRLGDPYRTLFVTNLAPVTTECILRSDFEVYGPIVAVRQPVPPGPTPRLPRPYAFIEYASERDAREAYKTANGRKLDGRRLVVDMVRGGTAPGWRPRRLAPSPPPPGAGGAEGGGGMQGSRPNWSGAAVAGASSGGYGGGGRLGVDDPRGRSGGGDYRDRERDRERDRLSVGEYRRGSVGGGGSYDSRFAGGGGGGGSSGGYDRGAYERLGGGLRDSRGGGRDGGRDRDRDRDRDGGRDGRDLGKGGWSRGVGITGGGMSVRDRLGNR